ncbi:transposase [Chromobacterium sphagni]|uniref:Transposase n=1 Tax=Chromobacterium sphagni TaxID=1903179 RepID=A0A1S1WSS3_9NEIS|nr:transposase [Chromobacterium sphagni]
MKTRKKYPVEFRAEAVKLVLEQGLKEAAQRLVIPKGTLSKANWVPAAKAGGDKPAPGARSVTELEAENARLRKELAEARLDRDLIKKAAAYFAQASLPGTRG